MMMKVDIITLTPTQGMKRLSHSPTHKISPLPHLTKTDRTAPTEPGSKSNILNCNNVLFYLNL